MTDLWVHAKKIDSFSDHAYGGNPAGVVATEGPLADDQMQRMAREMNLSETVFVAPDAVGEADVRLRYFTPTVEVPICGHATIAALHHLHDEGPERDAWRLSTRVGVLAGRIEGDVAWTGFDRTEVLGVWPEDPAALLQALGAADVLAAGARPVLFHDRNLAIEVRDAAALDALRPDLDALDRLVRQDLDGVIVFTQGGTASGITWHQRYFAPGYGIPEDPVTGLAAARTAALLARLGRFAPGADGMVRAAVRQGDALGRPGRIEVRLRLGDDGAVASTEIGGRAVTTMTGRMRLPAPAH